MRIFDNNITNLSVNRQLDLYFDRVHKFLSYFLLKIIFYDELIFFLISNFRLRTQNNITLQDILHNT